jgi:cytochrome c
MSLRSAVCAAGDGVLGDALYASRCVACHAMDLGRVGPTRKGAFGRRASHARAATTPPY